VELVHENNTAEAAGPPAIVTATPFPKLPLYDNDPTRDLSARQRWAGAVALVVSMAALVVLAIAVWLLHTL
jgi:hypothetical protein